MSFRLFSFPKSNKIYNAKISEIKLICIIVGRETIHWENCLFAQEKLRVNFNMTMAQLVAIMELIQQLPNTNIKLEDGVLPPQDMSLARNQCKAD